MRFLFLLSFLCLPFTAGRELAAHDNHDSLQKIADKNYRLTDLKMSEDGSWLTIRKSYDLNRDTVLIFGSRQPEKPVGYRTKTGGIVFLSNDNLLMQRSQRAELFNPEEQTAINFEGVKLIQAFRDSRQFLLQYNEEGRNRLELRDSSGELLNAIDNASRFYTIGDKNIFVITKNENGTVKVVLIKDKTTDTVYVTSRTISSLKADPGEKGIMVYEQDAESNLHDMIYLDLATKTHFSLKEALSVPIQNASSEVIREGNIYFLKLLVNREKEDTSLVDIWYGSDNRLEEKFYPPTRELFYVWKPKEKNVRQIGNGNLTTGVNVGNDRYFLSFDPYCLQDYTSWNPILQMYVYDRLQNRYSVLDTIAPELYLSGNGEYALAPKDKGWYLYHIPSVSKMLIPGDSLVTPWFTSDGNAVLFDGEGTLWKYELKSSLLTEIVTCDGCQISIINYIWKGLGIPRGSFYKNQVNLHEPLVIKLFNPQENVTSYILWHKGKSKIIIPPTAMLIQFLKYNKSFDRFSWVEEDYNLPPRLVYKELDKEKKVLYQSNKADTAILSLKREVISYTNSDVIPLKGVLYYPLHYTPSKKYPMVVHIYQVQSNKTLNEYPAASYSQANSDGFKLRLLLEKGYFVYFPDIVYGENGPGLSALDCVNNALDALNSNVSIDKSKIGLIGHSHGGYETNFIATHSGRFATYVSGAGNSDIVRSYFSYNYNFRSPFYWQYENGQYEMKKSFSEDKNLYFQNNPIYYVDQVNAPVLLWTGMKDRNIYWEQTMEFYIGLKRNKKKVVALFYPDEAHAFNTPEACKDLVSRILTWFDYFLKGDENIKWIDMEMKRLSRQLDYSPEN